MPSPKTQKRAPGTIDALLARLPLLAGLDASLLAQIARAGRTVELAGHRPVFQAGELIQDAHFLLAGSIQRYALHAGDAQKVLELVTPGQVFALSELFTGETYASFAETLQPSTLLAVPIAVLRGLMTTHLALSNRLLDAVARSYYASEFDIVRHRSLSVAQRVLDYLLSLSSGQRQSAGETTVHLVASKRVIAARLDVAPETLSRTLRQLSDDGLIVVDKRTVHIQNAAIQLASPVSRDLGPAASTLHYPRLERGSEPKALSHGERVNLCGRQRMLSQRLASHWVMIRRALAVQESRVALRKHKDQFQRNLRKLAEIDWPEHLQAHLDSLERAWQVYEVQLSPPETEPAAMRSAASALFEQSEAVLAAADQLTVAVARHAATTEAAIVNTAGRNRMLCARLITLFLFRDWGVGSDRLPALMAASREEFQKNLAALGHTAAHSLEAQEQLAIDGSRWAAFLEQLDAKNAGPQHTLAVVQAGEALLRHADTTVKVYERLSDIATAESATV